jgi:tRNA pseudouridine38-40 synthase
MPRYRSLLEYDGTDFLGFQRQAAGRTVQGEVEAALGRLGWTGRTLWGAGRTDAGVHASGQVIAFDLEWAHGAEALGRALNANLPSDVAAREVAESEAEFHPRYSARGRRYRYTLYNQPVRSPLAARYSWQVWPALDVAALRAASEHLLGRHDFASFGIDPDGGTNTVRTVRVADWAEAPGGRLTFDIEAEAFLQRMVRSVVGALRQVGGGALSAGGFADLLAAKDRRQCPPAAPPQGLCLVAVLY